MGTFSLLYIYKILLTKSFIGNAVIYNPNKTIKLIVIYNFPAPKVKTCLGKLDIIPDSKYIVPRRVTMSKV